MPDQPIAIPLSKEQVREATAMVECLAYLEDVANKAGFSLVAHMISLARQSTSELLTDVGSGGGTLAERVDFIGHWRN